MTIQEMRNAISDAYDGERWKAKVACMYEDQVIAIYFNFLERGVFNKPKNQPVTMDSPQIVQQLSIFDFVEVKEKMTHKNVWEKFKECNGIVTDMVSCWFPNGKNSIRIRLKEDREEFKSWAGNDLVFTYKSKKEWKLETVDSYLASIKVEAN
jgi:hypothetical protein